MCLKILFLFLLIKDVVLLYQSWVVTLCTNVKLCIVCVIQIVEKYSVNEKKKVNEVEVKKEDIQAFIYYSLIQKYSIYYFEVKILERWIADLIRSAW